MDELKTLSGRRASQRADELLPFIDLLRREGVRSYLEVGARHGDTFDLVARALPAGSRVVAVDLGGGPWGTPKSVAALRAAVAGLSDHDAHLILGDSTDPSVVAAVAALGPFDAILIDGDHRYDGVLTDWFNYGPMGRLVAFHDIVGEGQTTRDANAYPVEVPRLWAEIRNDRSLEFVGAGSAMGIGVMDRRFGAIVR